MKPSYCCENVAKSKHFPREKRVRKKMNGEQGKLITLQFNTLKYDIKINITKDKKYFIDVTTRSDNKYVGSAGH